MVSIDFNKESPADIELKRDLSFVFNNYQEEPRKVQEYHTLSRKKTMYVTQQSFGHSYGKSKLSNQILYIGHSWHILITENSIYLIKI